MSGDHGCGCGGGGATSVAADPCGCADVAAVGTAFVRPRFFGGMLLTEDDLQATIDYAVAKRRLTNRNVIGTGVVCGLDVAPHPCDPRSVIVSPGHAIECCGNDIVVGCPEELDVIDLLQDLRRRTGTDCGEPCDDEPRLDYHLYVRYVERLTAPVAPYAPDDCATGDCEFSRVAEGYRFELRCDPPDDLPTLIGAIEECRMADAEVARQAEDVSGALRLVERRQHIVGRLESGAEPAVAAPAAAQFRAIQVNPADPSEGVRFDDAVKLVTRSLVAQAQVAAADPGTRRPIPAATRNRTRELASALRRAGELTELPDGERRRVERLLDTAIEERDFSTYGRIDRAWLSEGTSVDAAEAAFASKAEAARSAVLRGLAARGRTATEDYRAVSGMRFLSLAGTTAADVARVARIFLKLARDCVCAAVNPPCPACADNAVLIARVRIEDCAVTDICALERRWVLSPRALGYWFPFVEAFREQLELLCCRSEKDRDASASASPYDMARAALVRLRETAGREPTPEAVADVTAGLSALEGTRT